jgi:hypothetical protein
LSYRRYDFSNIGENQTSRLQPHPLNDKVYGASEPDEDLLRSVAEHGIFNPIVINRKKEILSGTRRWLAAKAAGYEKVPVLILLSNDSDLLSELFLIESNRARVKTPEQIGREFTELKRIETGLAKQRIRSGKKIDPTAKWPEGGEAAAKAAKAVGLGVNSAKKIEAITAQADAGNFEARAVLDEVNRGEKSVNAAHKQIFKKDSAVLRQEDDSARILSSLFESGTVSRSKTPGLFHLTLRDLSEVQVREIAKNTLTKS